MRQLAHLWFDRAARAIKHTYSSRHVANFRAQVRQGVVAEAGQVRRDRVLALGHELGRGVAPRLVVRRKAAKVRGFDQILVVETFVWSGGGC